MLYKLLTLFVALVPVVVYPLLAAKKDYFQIEANGSWNSLKDSFHHINVWLRVLMFGSVGVLAFKNLFLLAAYGLVSVAVFWVLFDRRLNKYRGLPLAYVGQTADLDVTIRKWAARKEQEPEQVSARLKLICLLFSIIVFFAALYFTRFFG